MPYRESLHNPQISIFGRYITMYKTLRSKELTNLDFATSKNTFLQIAQRIIISSIPCNTHSNPRMRGYLTWYVGAGYSATRNDGYSVTTTKYPTLSSLEDMKSMMF